MILRSRSKVLFVRLAYALLKRAVMSVKPPQPHSKNEPDKAARKSRKGATETSRLFIDVDEMIRRPQPAPLTRYVE